MRQLEAATKSVKRVGTRRDWMYQKALLGKISTETPSC